MSFSRPSRSLAAVALAMIAPMLTGCYNYVPVENPSPGALVRMKVPVRTSVRGSNEELESFAIEGVVVSSGDTVVLATTVRAQYGAFREVTLVDTLRAARVDLVALDEKVYSRQKSVALGVVIAGGIALLIGSVTGFAGGSEWEDVGDGTMPNASVVLTSALTGLLGIFGR